MIILSEEGMARAEIGLKARSLAANTQPCSEHKEKVPDGN